MANVGAVEREKVTMGAIVKVGRVFASEMTGGDGSRTEGAGAKVFYFWLHCWLPEKWHPVPWIRDTELSKTSPPDGETTGVVQVHPIGRCTFTQGRCDWLLC